MIKVNFLSEKYYISDRSW